MLKIDWHIKIQGYVDLIEYEWARDSVAASISYSLFDIFTIILKVVVNTINSYSRF
jgi:hypothetical protein